MTNTGTLTEIVACGYCGNVDKLIDTAVDTFVETDEHGPLHEACAFDSGHQEEPIVNHGGLRPLLARFALI